MFAFKKLTAAAVSVLAVCVLAACSEKGPSGTPVEKVNDTVITKPQLDRAVQALLANRHISQPLPPEQMKQATEAALQQLTDMELLYQEGKKEEIKDLDKLVEQRYAQNVSSFPTKAEYDKSLKSAGMTEADVKEMMRKEIVVNNFIRKEFFSKAACTDADAKKFFDENKEKYFHHGEQLNASHILVSVAKDAKPQEKKAAREKAEALLKRVKAGEDFAQLAAKESTCPSRTNGGHLGTFGRGQMTPPFEKAAYALKKGEISPVVETEFGYHIIKLDDRIAPHDDRFEEVKDKIATFMKQEQTRKAVAGYLAELRKKASIKKS